MALTRAMATEAFNHVLSAVFRVPKDGPLMNALVKSGDGDIVTMLSLNATDIDSLTYDKSETEKDIPLPQNQRSLLHIFKQYIVHWYNIGDPIEDNWMSISAADFDRYRTSPEYQLITMGANTQSPVVTPRSSKPSHSPVDNFKRGLKCDPSLFMLFKDGKLFDSWQCSTVAQACAQDVAEILYPIYVPRTQDDIDLFQEKQKYMFAVFERTLQTDTGKAIVRDHEDDADAQEVYTKVIAYYLKSTKASLDSSTLLSYITSVRLGSGMWKGPTYSFVLHWQDKVRLYEKQVPASDHFSAGQKCVMLQNTVHPSWSYALSRT